MDWGETIALVVFLAGIAGLLFMRIRLRKTKRVFIMDYQRGVHYKSGTFAGELGPGSYEVYTPKEQVVVVDMRPQPFVIERLLYHDALKAPSVISLGAELRVDNPFTACTALKDQVNESIAIVRDALRETVSNSIADAAPEGRGKIASDIEAAANKALNRVGMRLSQLEITEVWSQFVRPPTMSGAN
ncbi:MAG: SPFH domain-containing protein [Terriglobales bacterium]